MRLSSGLQLDSGRRRRVGVGASPISRILAELDWPLVLVMGVIMAIGLANLYSATAGTPNSGKFIQQTIWLGLGTALFVLLTVIDYRSWHRVAWISLALIVVAILLVRFVSKPINGSTRWLIIGAFRVQPSELAKIAVVLATARFLHDARGTDHHRIANPIQAVALLAALSLPIVLIALQPDLGSGIMVMAIAVSMALLMVRNVWPIFGAIGVGLASLPLLWQGMEDYQKDRVLALMDPSSVSLSKGWQTQQSLLAVGSGRITGKGFGEATQNRFNFLPEHWTDFPFSVWGEEWGFVGCLGLLVLFALLILLCINAASRAPDRFGTAICLGVAAMIFWQLVVNVSMVLGMAPVVGVTLPLISYGGSSMLAILVGLGLVSSVSMRRHAL